MRQFFSGQLDSTLVYTAVQYYPDTRVYTPSKFSTGTRFSTCTPRITVTLSIFIFSTWFFAQIVENRRGRLSIPFLGPGDFYSKSYDENQIWSKWVYVCAGLMRRSSRLGGLWTVNCQIRARDAWIFFLENLRNVARALRRRHAPVPYRSTRQYTMISIQIHVLRVPR